MPKTRDVWYTTIGTPTVTDSLEPLLKNIGVNGESATMANGQSKNLVKGSEKTSAINGLCCTGIISLESSRSCENIDKLNVI